MARRAMTRGRPTRPPTPHDRRVVPTFAGRPPAVFTSPWRDTTRGLHLSMARRAMTRGRLSRPPTPHDRLVVPTFAGRPLAAFTLPPRQDELWPEGRSTFPGEVNQH
ncbi:hypothetical protein CRG98_039576 [Punica granatum]|uniref:Uncharacterized protein n=1 Tax=Punica granatum TaxID=22663 RepID=A0A2I0I9G6_PUNGR|nr:hypothetical protein CRG98_039576 [Punica granatum]